MQGPYCQHCGQENIVPKESFWGLLTHFVYDITHFDGKFFATIKLLLGRPGFLSLEYLKGRRMSYLHPIRMYVFTSALFFVVFFMLYNAKNMLRSERVRQQTEMQEIKGAILNLEESLPKLTDSLTQVTATRALQGLKKDSLLLSRKMAENSAAEKAGQKEENENPADSLSQTGKVTRHYTPSSLGDLASDTTMLRGGVGSYSFRSVLAYTRVQAELPPAKRDGWIERNAKVLLIRAVQDGMQSGKMEYMKGFIDQLLHSVPKMLFVSLPLFALFLKLLYVRHRQLYYADHAIYTIHLYCATFIFLLGWFALARLNDTLHWTFISFIQAVTMILVYFYQYKSMRVFYGQSRLKTIAKFFLLNTLSLLMMIFLLMLFTAISVAQLPAATAH